ncbi:acyltransferase [Pseudomonas sp. RIT-PI-S]|uniref:acyltransferase family protein n=1 Tax=Pseudomonas sp. RIT-PI-S TaxID=3035295 RepID=UPI0021D9670B|nr:acyltransferase [Pseudomonas sp. RIT-PI-S]
MLISVQALRAIAAWMVVCHHFMQIFFNFEGGGPIGHLFAAKGSVGVDIFFVISGLVIYLSTWDKPLQAREFLLNRAIRIIPAYWFYTAAMGLLLYTAGRYIPHGTVSLSTFILSLLFIPAENPGGYGLYPTLNVGWTLNYEMFFYLLFSLAFLVPKALRAVFVAVALLVTSEALSRLGWSARFYANNIVYEFLLGIAIGIAWRRGWIGSGVWLPLAAICASAAMIYQLEPTNRLLNWGLPSAGIVASCLALESRFSHHRGLKALGDCSYSVYLVHLLVLYAGWFISARLGINPYLVFAAFCVPTILALSWLSYQWLEKRLYHRMKAWMVKPRENIPAGLTRQNY